MKYEGAEGDPTRKAARRQGPPRETVSGTGIDATNGAKAAAQNLRGRREHRRAGSVGCGFIHQSQ